MINFSKRLTVIAGGTGGHIIPGITIVHYLVSKGWKVRWIGTLDRIESDLVPKNGIEIDFIRISSFRGKGIKVFLLCFKQIIIAFFQARTILKQYKPNIVLGMGGYVSGPSGLAAWSLGIPIILHEQNGVAGLANKWLSSLAHSVIQAFPGTFPKAKVIGNPVRKDILSLPNPELRFQNRRGPIRILVIGGSQGAKIFNKVMPEVAKILGHKIIIWHQSGKGSKNIVKKAYLSVGHKKNKVSEFIDNISIAYSWADVVICRSGALTVSEISVVGLAAVFVPFQHKDRQQYWNAFPLEKIGAANIIEQQQLTAEKLSSILSSWNRKILLKMAQQARTIAIVDATEKLAEEINYIVENKFRYLYSII